MKKIICIIASLFVAGTIATFAQSSPDNETYLKGIKEQVSLPPQIAAFISFKEQQAKDIAQKNGFELDADFNNFFAAAKAGRERDAERARFAFRKNFQGTNLTPILKSPLQQAIVDVVLVDQALGQADADLVLALGQDLMNSLPPNCIYFGGTDPGRGLPTMLCKAPGDPVFVLSQNPLADSRYREYVRTTYGTRIQIPATNEFQGTIDAFSADTQRRWQHDQDFPNEPKQLRPGESVHLVDGKPRLEGAASIMGLNAQLVKAIFDKNLDREFYYEESWPLDWLYPYLSPHGAVLKINRQPLNTIPADAVKADAEFWKHQVAAKLGDWLTADRPLSNVCAVVEKIYAQNDLSDFKGNTQYIHTEYIQAPYAKLRNSIARVYEWRLKNAHSAAEKQQGLAEAELAYRQSFMLCPHLPEMVYAYANFLLENHRLDDALQMVKTAVACSPKTNAPQFTQLLKQLEGFKNSPAIKPNASPAPPAGNKPTTTERLKKVKSLYDQGLINKEDYDKKVKEIMDSL